MEMLRALNHPGRARTEGQPRIAKDALEEVREEDVGGGAVLHARALLAANVAVPTHAPAQQELVPQHSANR